MNPNTEPFDRDEDSEHGTDDSYAWHSRAAISQPPLVTEPADWSPPIERYLRERGLSIEDAVETLTAEPCVLVQRKGHRAPAMKHRMYSAFGPSPRDWILVHHGGDQYGKFAAPMSGDSFSIAAPRGADPMGIVSAKDIAIAEGPIKASAIAVATGMYAVAGHGVAFGSAAWLCFKLLLGGRSSDTPLKRRRVFIVGDDGDLEIGHAHVHRAVGRLCSRAKEAGADVRLVRHPK